MKSQRWRLHGLRRRVVRNDGAGRRQARETASHALSVRESSSVTQTKRGNDSNTSYSHRQVVSEASTLLRTGNDVSGLFSLTQTSGAREHLQENGSYHANNTYEIDSRTSNAASLTRTGNAITGSYSLSESTSSTTNLGQDGYELLGGGFRLEKDLRDAAGRQETGNDVTGSYVLLGGTVAQSSTARETTSHALGDSSFTEINVMGMTRTGSGNRVTGIYTINASESHGSNLEAVGRNFGNSYSVTESVGGTSTMTRRGNAVTGAYTLSENTSDQWKYSHLNNHGSDGDFTLDARGLNVFRRTDVGNDILGTYDRSWSGTDSFSMTETGHTTLGAFSEQLTGKEEYHLGESGNPDTGAFKREVKGNGSYDRVMSGPGATLPSGPGNFNYLNQETGNKKTGSFSLNESGQSRYALLELWNNVSNTTAGFTPGQLDFFSFGVPFVDPGPGGESRWYDWGNDWAETNIWGPLGAMYAQGGAFQKAVDIVDAIAFQVGWTAVDFTAALGKAMYGVVGVEIGFDPRSALFTSIQNNPALRADLNNRLIGGLQIIGGLAEMGLGIMVAPVPVVGQTLGVFLLVHGSDQGQAGISAVLTGRPGHLYIGGAATVIASQFTDAQTAAEIGAMIQRTTDYGAIIASMGAPRLIAKLPAAPPKTAPQAPKTRATAGATGDFMPPGNPARVQTSWTQGTNPVPSGNPARVIVNDQIGKPVSGTMRGSAGVVPKGVLPKPTVSDAKLQNYVDNFYKGTTNPNRVGTGTTADAVRAERATGQATAGKFHTQKAVETVRGLQSWLRNNPNASNQDRLVAQSLLDDLLDALGRSK